MAIGSTNFFTLLMLTVLILSFRFIGTFAFVNLSIGKLTHQTSTYPPPRNNASWFIASNAVDGNPSSCTRSNVIGMSSPYSSMWWRVDLGDIHSIHSIRIIFKDYGPAYELRQRGRFAGFSIYVSNSSNSKDWVLCYKGGPELPPLDFNTTCMKNGRYFIYYNERLKSVTYPNGYETMSIIELCEVIVYGCAQKGVYGMNCDVTCPVNCQEQRCHIVNGSCMGCRPGWTGDKCDKCMIACPDGWYGSGCKNKCFGHCKNKVSCHRELGSCVGGCSSGWMGAMCDIECEEGMFGPGCIHNCSGNSWNNSNCNKQTGDCNLGCNPGFTGTLCDNIYSIQYIYAAASTSKDVIMQVCPVGKFGILCRETCSGHCINETKCHYVDGTCREGCSDGYSRDKCNESCQKGLFGSNCSQKCSINCRTAHECSNTDGSCVCSPGWTGSPSCNKECDTGFYGENCQNMCSCHCINMTCDKVNGTCLIGCKNPFYGDKCDQGGEKYNTISSYAKEHHTVSGILGALLVVMIILFAVLYIRWRIFIINNRTPQYSNSSTQIDNEEKGHSDANAEKDRALYQELSVFENKSVYQELHAQVEGNPYQNFDLTTH